MLMSRMMWLLAAFWLVGACKPEVNEDSHAMHIIGENDMQKLYPMDGEYQEFAHGISASVLLVMDFPETKSKRYCSGFIFEKKDDYLKVLSNHHCFAVQEEKTGKATETLVTDICSKVQVYFNAVEGLESSLSRGYCVEGTLVTSFTADIAVFAVAGDIPSTVEAIKIVHEEELDVEESEAYIIHYPKNTEYITASADFGHVRLPAAIITSSNCNILGNFAPEQFDKNPVLALSYKHTCDLTDGSSGSPLISQSSHNLVGLNWGGVKSRTTYGTETETEVSNAAVKPSHILSFLHDNVDFDSRIADLVALAKESRGSSAEETTTASGSDGAGCATLVAASPPRNVGITWWFLLLLPCSMSMVLLRSSRRRLPNKPSF